MSSFFLFSIDLTPFVSCSLWIFHFTTISVFDGKRWVRHMCSVFWCVRSLFFIQYHSVLGYTYFIFDIMLFGRSTILFSSFCRFCSEHRHQFLHIYVVSTFSMICLGIRLMLMALMVIFIFFFRLLFQFTKFERIIIYNIPGLSFTRHRENDCDIKLFYNVAAANEKNRRRWNEWVFSDRGALRACDRLWLWWWLWRCFPIELKAYQEYYGIHCCYTYAYWDGTKLWSVAGNKLWWINFSCLG